MSILLYRQWLSKQGKPITHQRLTIAERALELKCPFSAEVLIASCAAGPSRPSRLARPTMYRCLIELVECGLLRRFELDGQTMYDRP
jgi:Fe2+ or Zn2+ uptake regulation protein